MTVRRRLYESRSNRMVAGVCGGVAEFFDIDPTIVRLLWILSIFIGGAGLILYIVAMFIMPTNPSKAASPSLSNTPRYIWGFVLIGIGTLLVLYNLGIVPFLWLGGFSWRIIFATMLIAIGAVLVFSHFRERVRPAETGDENTDRSSVRRRLYRSIRDRKIFGVCGGLGEYFEIDPTIVRLVFVFVTLYSFGFGILAYIILAIVTPEEHFHVTAV